MKKYQVLVTGICSLMLVFGVAITACKHDTGSSSGGILDEVKKGRGDSDSNVKPSAPGSIVATVASESSITLTWSPVPGASAYKVHRANDSSGSYDFRAETTNSTYTDTGVSPGTPYFYKVSAYNSVGESPQSSSFASAVIIGSNGSSVSRPTAPTGVTATRLSSDEVFVTWNPVSGVTTYIVYWAEEAAGPYALEDTANTPSHTSNDWTGYDYGYFKVSAVNAAGESPLSDYARFGSYSNGGNSWSVPSAPSVVYASASSSSTITVSWSEVSGASGYRIYRALDQDDLFSYQGNTSDTYYSDTGLTQGTTYYYKIAAYNNYGESQPSTAAPAKTQESIPSAPSSVYASASSSSSITVYWSEVYGVTSYTIYRSQSSYGNYYSIATVSGSSTSYTNTGLSPGTTYYYKVSGSNGAGESSQSTYYGEATTWPSSGNSGSLLPAPTGVNAYKLSSDEAYVWWNPVSGAKEYVVYWASSETGTYYYDGTTNDTSFISTNWGGGYAYFKIAAVNNAGYEGALSAPVSVYLGWSSYSVGTMPVEKMGTIRRTE